MTKPEIIFFGNGPLADYTLDVLRGHCKIIFHAHTAADLATVAELKQNHPAAFGILASFGVLIRKDLLDLFAPTGILNLHPSLLPKLRGPSPIESAILAGDTDFSYSIMRLSSAMDAGPIFHQETLKNLPLNKDSIYRALATAGATWLVEHLSHLPEPTAQDDSAATYCAKLDKSMSTLHPESHTAAEIFRQIVAYQSFPKPKFDFYGKTCIILEAHPSDSPSPLAIKCADEGFVSIDRLQPEGKKPMDARSFLNGYAK